MTAITEVVQFARRLPNGHFVGTGNQVQIENADGEIIGTAENPMVTSVDSVQQTVSPSLSTTPDYQAGDVVGTIISLAVLSTAVAGAKFRLKSVHVADEAGQAPALLLYFFTATPTGGTYTDNAAVVWGALDGNREQGVVSIAAANYVTVAGKSSQSLSGIDQIHVPSDASIFMLVIANGAYNAAADGNLIITVSWERV